MNVKQILAPVSLALLLTTNASANGWYLGGGVEIVSFGGDLEDVDSGVGFAVSGGYRFPKVVGIDVLWGGSAHDENLSNGWASQGNFLAGAKFFFNPEDTFQPYLTVGLSGHAVDFEFFEEITGSGFYWGFGADIFVARRHAINATFRSSSWTGEDSEFSYDVTTGIISVVYNYHFGR